MINSDINKLALRNYYETHKDDYYKKRLSTDKDIYDEQYKWEILPKLNQELSSLENITKDNVGDFIGIITRNENKANFVHWIDMDDFNNS